MATAAEKKVISDSVKALETFKKESDKSRGYSQPSKAVKGVYNALDNLSKLVATEEEPAKEEPQTEEETE